MLKKIFSTLGLLLIAAACQPQQDSSRGYNKDSNSSKSYTRSQKVRVNSYSNNNNNYYSRRTGNPTLQNGREATRSKLYNIKRS